MQPTNKHNSISSFCQAVNYSTDSLESPLTPQNAPPTPLQPLEPIRPIEPATVLPEVDSEALRPTDETLAITADSDANLDSENGDSGIDMGEFNKAIAGKPKAKPTLVLSSSLDECFESFCEVNDIYRDTYSGSESYLYDGRIVGLIELWVIAKKAIRAQYKKGKKKGAGYELPVLPGCGCPTEAALSSSKSSFQSILETYCLTHTINSLQAKFEALPAKDNGALDAFLDAWPNLLDRERLYLTLAFKGYVLMGLYPGSKFELMPCIVGPPGIGKTDFVNYWASAVDHGSLLELDNFSTSRDRKIAMTSASICFYDDLKWGKVFASSRNVKGFLSFRTVNYTPKNSNTPLSVPKSFINVSNNNYVTDLPSDPAHRRRFTPIITEKLPPEDYIAKNMYDVICNAKFLLEQDRAKHAESGSLKEFQLALTSDQQDDLLSFYEDCLTEYSDDQLVTRYICTEMAKTYKYVPPLFLDDSLRDVLPDANPKYRASLRTEALEFLGSPKTYKHKKPASLKVKTDKVYLLSLERPSGSRYQFSQSIKDMAVRRAIGATPPEPLGTQFRW